MDFFKPFACRIPRQSSFRALLKKTEKVLQSVPDFLRPRDAGGNPGGLLCLDKKIPAVIVPDLHGRYGFLSAVIKQECRKLGIDRGGSVADALAAGQLYLLLLGDIFHTERHSVERWKKAYEAYSTGSVCSIYMKEEMAECFATVMLLMNALCAAPEYVHCLKGNHENILNREGGGDFPFYKYAAESSMVYDFMLEWGGPELLLEYSDFEHLLPIFAKGSNFLASHAEPVRPFSRDELIGAGHNSDVVAGLTWTKNDEADPLAAGAMLHDFFPGNSRALYFGGHRSIRTAYNVRAGGKFIQIHNPDLQNVAVVFPDRHFSFETDIRSCP